MSAIKFSAKKIDDLAKVTTQCIVVPVAAGKTLPRGAKQVDKASAGAISATLKLGDFTGKCGQSCMLPGAGAAKRILLLGMGDIAKFDRAAARQLIQTLSTALGASSATDAVLDATSLKVIDGTTHWLINLLAKQLTYASYRYTETVSKPKPPMALKRVVVAGDTRSLKTMQKALGQGAAIGRGINETRRLADLPGNICTPSYLAQQARKLARAHDALKATVVEEKAMRDMGMGSFLSVTAGTRQPAKLIVLNYKGAKAADKPYVLVGKGITFDSGGISLKPGAKMDEMKYDMGGAASVFGTLSAVAEMRLPLNVVGIVAAAENMPAGDATKPGDVVTSMSGKTIEILNTDAEGRLVLCDALTYAARFKPETVIDIATLTGACVVALGAHATGLYSNQEKLAKELLDAGIESHDRAWQMPLWDDYQKQLNSNFADMANIGGAGGGSVTAACFLARFAEDYHWAHMDIAGVAWTGAPKGATGRPVGLLTQYLLDRLS